VSHGERQTGLDSSSPSRTIYNSGGDNLKAKIKHAKGTTSNPVVVDGKEYICGFEYMNIANYSFDELNPEIGNMSNEELDKCCISYNLVVHYVDGKAVEFLPKRGIQDV